jgi:hypothetical protein
MTAPAPSPTSRPPLPGELSNLQREYVQPLINAINGTGGHRASVIGAACQALLHGITPDERARVFAYLQRVFQQGLN